MSDRPDYIYTGGSPLQHTPMHLNASDMYGFFIKGDLAKLQASVDATLNRVAAGRMQFEALSPYVMLTFTRVSHAQSSFSRDYQRGWGKETDIITWILVGEMVEVAGEKKLHRLFNYPFHVWVDVPTAISIGREVFGYSKNMCEYAMPQPGGDPRHFSLASEGWHPFAPTSELGMHPLLEIHAVSDGTAHRPVAGFINLLREGLTLLTSEPSLLNLDGAGVADLVSLLLKPRVDQIFLKQFPDASGLKAVYQAVVTAPAMVDKVHSAHILGYDYECTLHDFDSFPLQETLGLQAGPQKVLMAFNINFDFTVETGEELVQAKAPSRQKIAVLGGGAGALSAAFHLTEQPNWQDRYEITVYQMGWRLGGKGASGRNASMGQRIEEHGLHIWFGFYDNAFDLMQKAYGALNRPPGAPLQTWHDAFKPQDFIALTEHIGGQWKVWPIQTPNKPGIPGHANEDITLWEIVSTLRAWIQQWLGHAHVHLKAKTDGDAPNPGGLAAWVEGLVEEVEDMTGIAGTAARAAIRYLAEQVPELLDAEDHDQHGVLAQALHVMRNAFFNTIEHLLEEDDTLRRLFICIDLAVTSIVGMVTDGVLSKGFDAINDTEFMDWLRQHGANEQFTVHSAPVVGLYDLVFAYEDGDDKRPNIEAGTMLRGIMRLAICYHGGLMWKMQAGMGDTVFTPIYQALQQRGVQFKFFHQVDHLVPDGQHIGEVVLTEQVKLAPGCAAYQPLVSVKGLDCWPSEPDHGQLDPTYSALLKKNAINLESSWSNWASIYQGNTQKELEVIRLKRGIDFDSIVYGLSVASLPHVCSQLLPQSPALKNAAEKIKSVATQAYQVWLTRDVPALGWKAFGDGNAQPVLSGFTEPFDTWAPMDQLLAQEDWPTGHEPLNVSYFCSVLPVKGYPPFTDTQFPAQCKASVKQGAMNQLDQQIHALWPTVGSPGKFDWQVLLDPKAGVGSARFDAQYWRANVDPSERYVLSVVGSTQYRPQSDGSGFNNLYLAGDWVKTGLNAGCVEAAVMGGMQASRAISGFPKTIKGETDR